MKSRKNDIVNAFTLGILTTLVALSLRQDFYGQDSYIEYVKNNWVDIHYGFWGVLLFICAITLFLMLRGADN